ncbi:MAG: carbon storage regulator [Eubacteriales bacterium]|nr:carbon storage regulator [Eubacteriales bacterium]
MLVISRKQGEAIYLSGDIKITLISVSGDKATIGIDAPKDIKIVREELAATIESNIVSAGISIEEEKYSDLANLLKKEKNI